MNLVFIIEECQTRQMWNKMYAFLHTRTLQW